MNEFLILTITGLFSFLISFYVLAILLKKSKKYNIKKANTNGIRWGSQKKPVSGGFVFVLLFLLSGIMYYMIYKNNILIDIQFIGIYIACIIAFMMGLADDIISTSPYFKFGAQIFCSLILIYFNVYINIFESETLNYLLTVFWIVLLMNSFNMLDNMDAITGAVSLVILSGIMFCTLKSVNNFSYSFVIIAVIGSYISFLYYNWNPSKLYMGDNGSQFTGALLGGLSIMFLWNGEWKADDINVIYKIIPVIFTFVIPLTDTATVTINRLLKGKSPFIGGKDHTTHFLYYRGLTERQISLFFLISTLITVSISVYIINFAKVFLWWHALLIALFAVVIFLCLYINTKVTQPK
ncbi:MAG: hypothetical protein Kow0068_03740 [Marinilabiliales bacterium]